MSKPIKIEVTGDASKFSKEMNKVDDKLGKLGKAAGVAGLALAGGLAAGGAALFQIGSDFEEMENIIIRGTGASGEALDGLNDSLKDVMVDVPESGAIVAGALADVNTFFGTTGDQLEDMTGNFLDFARVSETDVGSAIGAVDAALTQFGLGAGDADEAMGDFLRISQATGAPMDKLLSQMETFGPIFSNAGFSLEETTAIFGQLETAGVNVTRVGPALNKFFRDAATAGEDPKEALEGVQQAMLSAGTEAEALNIATAAFGAEGAQRMTSAIRNGSLDLANLNSLMGEGAGLVGEQAEATETFSDKWNTFKNKVLVKLEPLATKLFDKLAEGMEWLESDGIPIVEGLIAKFQEFSGWFRENQDYIIGALAALGTVILVAVVPPFVAWAAATIIAIAPIILIAAAAAALGVAVVALWKNWDKIWGWIKDKVFGFGTAITNKVSSIKDSVVGFITGIPGQITALGQSFLNAGKTLGGKILTGIRDGLTAAVGFAGNVASGLWRKVKDAVNSNVVDKINTALPNSISLGPFGNIDLPDNPVPRLAAGSRNFRGGMALVGEQGPELVAMPRGSRVFTARETEDMARNSGGGSTSITINAQTNANPREIASELGWALRTGGR